MLRNLLIASTLILVATPVLAEGDGKRKCDKCADKFERMFNAKDSNGDGVLTKDEAPKVVEHADANGDGQVTKDEAKEAAKKHLKRKHDARKGDRK